MHRFTLVIALAVVFAASVGMEAFTGRLAGFDQQRAMIDAQGKRLAQLRQHFGNWQMQEELEIPEADLQQLDCRYYVARSYVHKETGELVTMALLVAPSGPLVAHLPKICFPARGLELINMQRTRVFEDDPQPRFFAASFRSVRPGNGEIWSVYSWNAGDGWQAPEGDPRWTLAAEPMLVKLQVVAAEPSGLGRPDAALRFLQDCLSELDADLFSRPTDADPVRERLR